MAEVLKFGAKNVRLAYYLLLETSFTREERVGN